MEIFQQEMETLRGQALSPQPPPPLPLGLQPLPLPFSSSVDPAAGRLKLIADLEAFVNKQATKTMLASPLLDHVCRFMFDGVQAVGETYRSVFSLFFHLCQNPHSYGQFSLISFFVSPQIFAGRPHRHYRGVSAEARDHLGRFSPLLALVWSSLVEKRPGEGLPATLHM
jgi:hypothetical protein